LPAAVQNYTTYVATLPARASADKARSDAALALIRHLDAPQTRAAFANAGIESAR